MPGIRSPSSIATLMAALLIVASLPDSATAAGGLNTWYLVSSHGGAVAAAPGVTGTVYTSEDNPDSPHVYKSINYGQTWFQVGENTLDNHAYRIIVSPGDSGIVLLVGGGLARSANGGTSWTTLIDTTWQVMAAAFAPSAPNIVYAGSRYMVGAPPIGQVFVSNNAGGSWSATSFNLTHGGVYDLAVDPNNPAIVYAAGFVTMKWAYPEAGVWKSTDSGEHWSTLGGGAPLYASSVAVDPTRDQSYFLGVNTLYDTTGGPILARLYKTQNGGGLWSPVGTGLPSESNVARIRIDPNGLIYVAMTSAYSTPGGVYRSVDHGASFANISSGLPGSGDVRDLSIDMRQPNRLYAATGSEVYTVSLKTDLSVALQATPASVGAGASTTVLATVRNQLGVAATQVSLKVPQPAQAVLGAIQPSQGSCALQSGDVECALGVLSPGATATVSLALTPLAQGSLPVTALASAFESDPNTADNHATIYLTVTDACTQGARPNVGLQVTQTGPGTLRAVVSAGSSALVPANRLTQVTFGVGTNAQFDIGDGTWRNGPYTVPIGAAPVWSFRIHRAAPGAFTQPLTVTDHCGPWGTFVGGGTGVP